MIENTGHGATVLQVSEGPATVAAMEANFWRGLREMMALIPEAEIHDDAEALWYITGVPHPLFNGITRLRLAPHDVERWSAWIMERYRARAVPMMWYVGASAVPAALGQSLESQGLAAASTPGMVADLRHEAAAMALPPDVEIVPVGDAASRTAAGHTMFTGLGFDREFVRQPQVQELIAHLPLEPSSGWHHYLALRNGAPAGAASLFLAEGVAGIYNVAVLPEARRRGIGGALTLRAMEEARRRGYGLAVLAATAMGAPVYRRLGFREFCTRRQYVWSGEESADHAAP